MQHFIYSVPLMFNMKSLVVILLCAALSQVNEIEIISRPAQNSFFFFSFYSFS